MKKKQKTSKTMHWTPRILAILYLLFLAMFSLDIFDLKLGFWGTIVGLLMHNLPVFFLLIILIISWKHELVGGIGFILAGLLYIAGFVIPKSLTTGFQWYYFLWILTISVPAFIMGILFLLNWRRKKR